MFFIKRSIVSFFFFVVLAAPSSECCNDDEPGDNAPRCIPAPSDAQCAPGQCWVWNTNGDGG